MSEIPIKPWKLFLMCTLGAVVVGGQSVYAALSRGKQQLDLRQKLFRGVFIRKQDYLRNKKLRKKQ